MSEDSFLSLEGATDWLSTGIELASCAVGPVSGPVVLFLHGVTDNRSTWHMTMAALHRLDPSLRLIAVDQRGHGESSYPAGPMCRSRPEACFRMADFAADVLALLDRRGIERAAIVGHSMGSLIAQEVALAAPERCRAIVLVGGTACSANNPYLAREVVETVLEGSLRRAFAAQGRVFPDEVVELTLPDAGPQFMEWLLDFWCVDPLVGPELPAQSLRATARLKVGTWLGAMRALLATDNRARLRALSVPALAIWGIQDVLFPMEPDQRELKEALAAAAQASGIAWRWKQYGTTPLVDPAVPTDIGHGVTWEAPTRLAEDIAGFLAERR